MGYALKKTTVGIRDAKANLSKLLKEVQKGAEIILTDRGRPVGKLVPVKLENLTLYQRIHALEKNGVLEPAKESNRVVSPISVREGIGQKILQEDRDS